MHRIACLFLALTFLACEGPAGPVGPAGPAGPQGQEGDRGAPGSAAATEFSLIEIPLGRNNYDDDNDRYVIRDARIHPDTVIGVYLKFFFDDTGDPFYVPFPVQRDLGYYVADELLFIVGDDVEDDLAGETVAVMVAGTS